MLLTDLCWPNPPLIQPRGQVVFLHGWGANASDLIGLAPLLNLPEIQYWSVDAPLPHPYSLEGRAWYDLEQPNWPGLPAARQQLLDWLQELPVRSSLGLDQTVLVGFSQGGAMTLDVGARLPLAGLAVLSGYPHKDIDPANFRPGPTLIVHGSQDTVVPPGAADASEALLLQAGAACERHMLTMGHEINADALGYLRQFLVNRLLTPTT
jgi:phospholipase/carboxylesterase